MSSSEFEEHLENEGWVEDEEDDVEESLTFSAVPSYLACDNLAAV